MKQISLIIEKYAGWIVAGIVILAFVLRIWQLGQVPPSPDWDEVALGYDAYSFIHTGRDEYGKFLPVVLRSFDDYKPALYAYLIVPFVYIFDLNVFAVRMPSVVVGTLTVLGTYFLVKELFKRKDIALLASLALALSPWHIQFSRIGFEANVGVGCNLFAALFFIKGLKKPWLLPLAPVFAALSIYAYQSDKVFAPLLLLTLVTIYWKDLIKVGWKKIFIAGIIGAIVISPMVINILTDKNALLRVKGTAVFSDQTTFLQQNVAYLQYDKAHHDILGEFLDNRRFIYVRAVIAGYIAHFDLNWLFIKGDIDRHHATGMGLLYLMSLPFFFIGIFCLLFNRLPFLVDKKSRWLILSWFLLVPIPASITTGLPHAVRTLNFLPMMQIFVAVGLLQFFFWIKQLRKPVAYILMAVIFIGYAFNITYYLDQYFVQYNYYSSADWQYGYQQAVAFIAPLVNKYDKVIISDKAPLDKSYMFFLFYLKYSPSEYQKVGQYSSGGFAEHHAFATYQFHLIDWNTDSRGGRVLLMGTPSEIPASANIIKVINNIDGSPAIVIADNGMKRQ